MRKVAPQESWGRGHCRRLGCGQGACCFKHSSGSLDTVLVSNSKHWFTTSFLWRNVSESDDRSECSYHTPSIAFRHLPPNCVSVCLPPPPPSPPLTLFSPLPHLATAQNEWCCTRLVLDHKLVSATGLSLKLRTSGAVPVWCRVTSWSLKAGSAVPVWVSGHKLVAQSEWCCSRLVSGDKLVAQSGQCCTHLGVGSQTGLSKRVVLYTCRCRVTGWSLKAVRAVPVWVSGHRLASQSG